MRATPGARQTRAGLGGSRLPNRCSFRFGSLHERGPFAPGRRRAHGESARRRQREAARRRRGKRHAAPAGSGTAGCPGVLTQRAHQETARRPSGCPRGAARPAAPRRGGAGIRSPSGSHDRPSPPAAPDEPPGRSAAGSTGSCPRGGGPGGAPRQRYKRPPQRQPPSGARRARGCSLALGLCLAHLSVRSAQVSLGPHPAAGACLRGVPCLRGLDARVGVISSSPPFVVLWCCLSVQRRPSRRPSPSGRSAAGSSPPRRPVVVPAKESRAGVGRASGGDDGGGGSSGCSRPVDVRVARRPTTTVTPGEGVQDRAGRPLS